MTETEQIEFQVIRGVIVFLVALLFGGLWFVWGGWPFSGIPDLFPTDVVAENRMLRDGRFLLVVFTGFWLLFATVLGVSVADPTFGTVSEKIVIFVGLLSLMTISGINWAYEDSLMNWRAQAALDALLVVFAMAVLLVMSRWRPKHDLLSGVRFLLIYICAVFGLILPLIYFSVALLIAFGMNGLREEDVDTYIKLTSFVLGFPAAAIALALGKERKSINS